jgi:hypothetical protein
MEEQTTLTISNKTRNTLMKMKYSLGYPTIEEVILSLIDISTKVIPTSPQSSLNDTGGCK